MSHQVAQYERVQAEDGDRRFDIADRPCQFEVIPNVCTIADVCHFLRVSERQLHYLLARKRLALVELERFDRTRRFLGESVAREIKRLATKRVA